MVLFKTFGKLFYGFGFGMGMSAAFYLFPKLEKMTPEEYDFYKKTVVKRTKRFLSEIDENDK